ncbi:hypothetical protein [Paenibacillus terrae]|uniref:hypothetical protein n=1 Tax=Paenibacillus terrae TaxID=159743 RepID=UPI00207B1AED|nr:hypothetical protein [Paenibacillus terrae]
MKKKLNVIATAVLLASITASYAYASSSTDGTTAASTSSSVTATQEDSATVTSTDTNSTGTSATVEAPPEGTPRMESHPADNQVKARTAIQITEQQNTHKAVKV